MVWRIQRIFIPGMCEFLKGVFDFTENKAYAPSIIPEPVMGPCTGLPCLRPIFCLFQEKIRSHKVLNLAHAAARLWVCCPVTPAALKLSAYNRTYRCTGLPADEPAAVHLHTF